MTRQRFAQMEDEFWGDRHRPRAGFTGVKGLRWGVGLADGRRVSISAGAGWRPDAPAPPAPVLVESDGSGSGGARMVERASTLWLWPLPEGDSLSLVVQWPALEIPVTTTGVDLAPVRAAAQRTVPFWP